MTMPYILIVDDDAALLQALPQALALRLKEVHVDTSDSALEALKYIQEHDYDAIVSDIKMPGMDGLALLAKVQEIRPETPTLLITGHGEHNLAIQALRGGAYDFIQKPIDRDYFVAALSRAIQMRQMRRQIQEQQQALELYARSLEGQVEQRTFELVKANAAKDEFLSMASHELKTPLASLKAMTQLLHRQHQRMNSLLTANLKTMERSIVRIEVLVNDLLDTSLAETGMFALHRTCFDLASLCRSVYDEYGLITNMALTLELPDEPVIVDIDINRISQVIINLLSNAHKYSPKGSPIVLKLSHSNREGIISVHDQGIGIPQDQLPKLFERFFRVPTVEVQNGSSMGLGLGLYISRLIVERHNGHIKVESIAGQGSTFCVSLPLAVDEHKLVEATEV